MDEERVKYSARYLRRFVVYFYLVLAVVVLVDYWIGTYVRRSNGSVACWEPAVTVSDMQRICILTDLPQWVSYTIVLLLCGFVSVVTTKNLMNYVHWWQIADVFHKPDSNETPLWIAGAPLVIVSMMIHFVPFPNAVEFFLVFFMRTAFAMGLAGSAIIVVLYALQVRSFTRASQLIHLQHVNSIGFLLVLFSFAAGMIAK